VSCISAHDPQLARLASAIAQKVGQQRFHVWFNNSTRLDLKQDGLEIAVPNDFISEWIGTHFSRPIQEAAHEVLGCSLAVRFSVVPQLFEVDTTDGSTGQASDGFGEAEFPAMPSPKSNRSIAARTLVEATLLKDAASLKTDPAKDPSAKIHPGGNGHGAGNGHDSGNGHASAAKHTSGNGHASANDLAAANASASNLAASNPHAGPAGAAMNLRGRMSGETLGHAAAVMPPARRSSAHINGEPRHRDLLDSSARPRLRHELETFVVGQSNQLAYNTALYVAEFPGAQYNPLFIHGGCGLGKTHLLQGLCKRFIQHHPTRRWTYLTGEEFTNEFLTALRANKIDSFRRKLRDLDLLVIDDVHFLGGKKATQEEFLHTFNAIQAMGRQVVIASDNHPKMIEEFGESVINRFVSGMVVRIDPPNFVTRCELLRSLSLRNGLCLGEEVVGWVARRVTQNVRELEGAVTRIAAHVKLTGRDPDVQMAQESLGDLDRQLVAPVRPENILVSVCNYFGLENKDLMSGRRQRTISLARSVAMYLVRKTAKLSFPEIGMRMGKRNHSTVISACRRIERAVQRNESLLWTSAVGEREEEATELLQRLEEHSRAMS
jgi:chromosomal replication initiator protein